MNIKIINDGGWHFSNIKTAKEIEHKLRSFLHHREFDINPLSIKQIDELIINKQAIHDLTVDKTVNKTGAGSKLEKFELIKLPTYIQKNIIALNSSIMVVGIFQISRLLKKLNIN